MQISSPTIILDKKKCLKNISLMAQKARANNLIFRPHFKSHQSSIIGQWFKDFGITKISVSSLEMAKYFAECGWNDITIAIIFNILEVSKLNALAENKTINIVVDSIETVFGLDRQLTEKVGVLIKIDLGNKRTGLQPENIVNISTIIEQINKSSNLEFKGFLGHSGNSYKAKNKEEILEIHDSSMEKVRQLKNTYKNKYPNIIFSIGDTPTNTLASNFDPVDEIRPGNFVFYDATQMNLGVCTDEEIALIVACPIISKHSQRGELIVHCGSAYLSKDYILTENNEKCYGKIVVLTDNGWSKPIEDVYISELFHEHGIIKASRAFLFKAKIGELIGIIPVHSCLTVSAMKQYQTIEGEIFTTMK